MSNCPLEPEDSWQEPQGDALLWMKRTSARISTPFSGLNLGAETLYEIFFGKMVYMLEPIAT